jgi:hypothetical protein
MLGGLWGFANKNNRRLGHKLFNIITNKRITNRYLENGQSKKGLGKNFYFYFNKYKFIFLNYSSN